MDMDMDRKPAAVNGEEVDVDTFAHDGKEVDVDTFDAADAESGDIEEQPGLGNGGVEEDAGEDPKSPAEESKLKDPPPDPSVAADEEMGTGNESGQDPENPEEPPAASKSEDEEAFEDEEGEGNSKKKPKREINPDFKDVKETGKWGQISRAEMIGVGVVLLLMIIGVVVGVVYAVVIKEEDTTMELIERETAPPTLAPTPMPPDEKFATIRSSIGSSDATADLLNGLPDDIEFYVDKGPAEDGTCAGEPHLCAMQWILYGDDFARAEDNLVTRYALASLYFSMGGQDWFNQTNWVTETSYCEWHGVKCSRVGSILEELDLAQNNVMGEIPEEMILLQTIQSISLKENNVSGPLPGYIFASLPSLFVLYVQKNNLSGPIPENLRDNGTLTLLFLHGNNFTGDFPSVYCNPAPDGWPDGMPGFFGAVFREYSVDCDENFCPESCCESLNCF